MSKFLAALILIAPCIGMANAKGVPNREASRPAVHAKLGRKKKNESVINVDEIIIDITCYPLGPLEEDDVRTNVVQHPSKVVEKKA